MVNLPLRRKPNAIAYNVMLLIKSIAIAYLFTAGNTHTREINNMVATSNGTKAVVNEIIKVNGTSLWAESVEAVSLPELDYIACKAIGKSQSKSMLILKGDRVSLSEGMTGMCGTGEVWLHLLSIRFLFGKITLETVEIDAKQMEILTKMGFSASTVLAIANEAKKAWCFNFKAEAVKNKKRTKAEAKAAAKIEEEAAHAKAIAYYAALEAGN